MATTPTATELGVSLTAARTRKGWTGRELARRAGIDHGYLWRIEHGKATTLERYDSIARAMGMVLTFRLKRG